MQCPKCGNKWGVTNTASAGKVAYRENILNHGYRLVSWYCEDFVVRIRKCVTCGHRKYTIELIINDLRKMFDIVSKEGKSAITSCRERSRDED